MSHAYGRANPEDCAATIARALDCGCNFLDTADEYGAGYNEELIGRTITPRRREVVLATKFGLVWSDYGLGLSINARPEHVSEACEASLRRLRTETIDLYYLHRVNPQVPIEETIGAMAELVAHGKVRQLGLCEVDASQLRRAHSVWPIAAIQSEYSLWWREPEREIIPLCEALKISFVAFSPLGRGFLTGAVEEAQFEEGDFRRRLPRFNTQNMQHNLHLVRELERLSKRKTCSPGQLALAWMLARSSSIAAIPGTTKVSHLEENLGALDVKLSSEEVEELDRVANPESIVGTRYPVGFSFAPETGFKVQ